MDVFVCRVRFLVVVTHHVAHCLRPRRARRDAAAAAAQCALQCMLAVKQRRRLTERVLSVLNVRGPSTGRVGRLSGCQARAALAHTPSIFRWSFFFYYSYTVLPPFPGCAHRLERPTLRPLLSSAGFVGRELSMVPYFGSLCSGIAHVARALPLMRCQR